MKFAPMALVLSLLSLNAFADAQGMVCQGASADGGNFTIAVANDNGSIAVNALGKRETFKVENVGGGDDYYEYGDKKGDLKVTFYDQGEYCSGWSKELGKFKGKITKQ